MIKKIVVAPDSFKGTLRSIDVCEIVEQKCKAVLPGTEVAGLPIADGGEGTVDAFLYALGGHRVQVAARGPLGKAVQAAYGILPDGKTAVIEMAAASGLPLISGSKRAMDATTYGTGQLLLDAAQKGCTQVILGVGGSATTDGGIGAMSALGVRFLDARGVEVSPDGKGLKDISSIDSSGLTPEVRGMQITIACDVKNPLAGESGAARIYGPQKGADKGQVEVLDQNLVHYSKILARHTGKDESGKPGMGAGGGICLSLSAFLNVQMRPGIDTVLDVIQFDEKIAGADLVITGEGRMDGQSLEGKAAIGVARRVRGKVPVVAVVGSVEEGYEAVYGEGISAVFPVNNTPVPFSFVKATSKEDLGALVESVLRLCGAMK